MTIRRSLAIAFLVVAFAGCGGGQAFDNRRSSPMTVPDMLRMRPAGLIEVRGNVIVHPDGSARLCEGLAGSYPPQCGGKSVAVTGLDLRVLEHPDSASGVTWGEATVRGLLVGDVLRLY